MQTQLRFARQTHVYNASLPYFSRIVNGISLLFSYKKEFRRFTQKHTCIFVHVNQAREANAPTLRLGAAVVPPAPGLLYLPTVDMLVPQHRMAQLDQSSAK